MTEHPLDEVGPWTEIKLEVLRKYAKAYSQIMKTQTWLKKCAYIDGFAGAGVHISRTTGQEIEGSPKIALGLPHRFSHYHFIDLDGRRAGSLRNLAEGDPAVTVHEGDCNEILLRQVFPQYHYESFDRALCLLDPYDLNPSWEVVQAAGEKRCIEIFLNFMIMDANMNVLRKNPEAVLPEQIVRMNAFWGDDSWRLMAYKAKQDLFGPVEEKAPNYEVAAAYQKRLREVAGFPYVPDPLPMKHSKGAIIYYLFFATHNKTGNNIVEDIFSKYR